MLRKLTGQEIQTLLQASSAAMKNSYSPYSHYQVGAALLSPKGQIYAACNVENASFGASLCAERCAAVQALAQAEHEFTALAIMATSPTLETVPYPVPCGLCLQFLSEFVEASLPIYVAKSMDDYQVYQFKDFFPKAFSLE